MNSRFRVALVVPSFSGIRNSGENLGVAYIESAVSATKLADVLLVNRTGDASTAQILSKIEAFQPDVVGIGLPSYHLLSSFGELATAVKQRQGCLVIGGGHYLQFRGHSIMEDVPALDLLVRGEGEMTIVEVMKSLVSKVGYKEIPGLLLRDSTNTKVIASPPRSKIEDLDTLLFPTRIVGLPVYSMSASRGCYTTCSFCSVPQFSKAQPGRGLRLRSVASIAKEAGQLKEIGAKAISFVDDVFLIPGPKGYQRACDIADVLHQLRLKWAFGCRTPDLTEQILAYCRPRGLCNIGLGIESAVPEILSRFSKRAGVFHSRNAIELCRKYDVSIMPYFIMFEPDMEVADIVTNAAFLNKYGLLWPSFAGNYLEPYPGTPAFDRLEKQQRVIVRYGRFHAKFRCERVEHLMNEMRPVLREAEKIEFALRRGEFESDLREDESRLMTRQSVRRQFSRLSQATYTFIEECIAGVSEPPKFLDEVEKLNPFN